MDLGLTGKRAAVTNAAAGIGRAIAERLVAEGCHVSISGPDADAVEHAKRALSRDGVIVTGGYVRPDDEAGHAAWLAATADQLDCVDMLIEVMAADAGHEDGRLDLTHTIRAVEAALPHLCQRAAHGPGSLLLVSPPDPAHQHGVPKRLAHAVLAGYARVLDGRDGLRVNLVAPGHLYEAGQAWSGTGPRAVRLDEVADLVVFLASPAAGLVHGLDLRVGG